MEKWREGGSRDLAAGVPYGPGGQGPAARGQGPAARGWRHGLARARVRDPDGWDWWMAVANGRLALSKGGTECIVLLCSRTNCCRQLGKTKSEHFNEKINKLIIIQPAQSRQEKSY